MHRSFLPLQGSPLFWVIHKATKHKILHHKNCEEQDQLDSVWVKPRKQNFPNFESSPKSQNPPHLVVRVFEFRREEASASSLHSITYERISNWNRGICIKILQHECFTHFLLVYIRCILYPVLIALPFHLSRSAHSTWHHSLPEPLGWQSAG